MIPTSIIISPLVFHFTTPRIYICVYLEPISMSIFSFSSISLYIILPYTVYLLRNAALTLIVSYHIRAKSRMSRYHGVLEQVQQLTLIEELCLFPYDLIYSLANRGEVMISYDYVVLRACGYGGSGMTDILYHDLLT